MRHEIMSLLLAAASLLLSARSEAAWRGAAHQIEGAGPGQLCIGAWAKRRLVCVAPVPGPWA
jgi:hypothetical protein